MLTNSQAEAGAPPHPGPEVAKAIDAAALCLRPAEHRGTTIIVLVGKGGGGKTTLTVNLASVAARLGYRVGVIDTDANSSAAEWRELRGRSDIPVRSCVEKSLAQDIAQARRGGIQILFIDTAPKIDGHLAVAIREADFVLVPTRPAQPDVTQTRRRVDLVRTLGKRFGVLINVAPPRRNEADARLVDSTRAALKEYGARLFCGQITHRHAVIWAMAAGRGVVETEPLGPASREYQAVFATIMRDLDGRSA